MNIINYFYNSKPKSHQPTPPPVIIPTKKINQLKIKLFIWL